MSNLVIGDYIRNMRLIVSLLLLVILVNCSTDQTTKLAKVTDKGLWQGKVVVTNQKTGKKKWVFVSWASDSSADQMKINASAVFDIPVATFVKQKQANHLWLYQNKQYFQSDNGPALFEKLLRFPLKPELFYDLLGEFKQPGPGWSCIEQDEGTHCKNPQSKASLKVDNSLADKRKIIIQRGDKHIEMRLTRSKVELKPSFFQLQQISGFERIVL